MNMKIGKNMRHALDFAHKNRGWHSYNTRDRATVNAIERLFYFRLIKKNRHNQFKITEHAL